MSLTLVSDSRSFNENFCNGQFFSYLFSLHTLTWACILQFKLAIMLVSHIFKSFLCIFQPNVYYYLHILCISKSQRIHKVKLLHQHTIEYTLHSTVKLPITQNLDYSFS